MQRVLLSLAVILFLSSCSHSHKDEYKNMTLGQVFDVGLQKMDQSRWSDAVEAFKFIDDYYPYSSTAISAQLLTAYCQFKNTKYADAIRELDLFIMFHKSHEYVPYALYLKGTCHLNQIPRIGCTQAASLKARGTFVSLATLFPKSEYANAADNMIIKLDNSVAAYEMGVAKFYQFERLNPQAALRRYLLIISGYSHTNQAPEALYRIIECYLQLGLHSQAEKTYTELRKAFPDNQWTRDAEVNFKSLATK